MVFQQKLLGKAYFIVKMIAPAMVKQVRSDKWKEPWVSVGVTFWWSQLCAALLLVWFTDQNISKSGKALDWTSKTSEPTASLSPQNDDVYRHSPTIKFLLHAQYPALIRNRNAYFQTINQHFIVSDKLWLNRHDFSSTAFLCSEFKVDLFRIYLLWSKFLREKCLRLIFICGSLFLRIAGKTAKIARISCHTVCYRIYLRLFGSVSWLGLFQMSCYSRGSTVAWLQHDTSTSRFQKSNLILSNRINGCCRKQNTIIYKETVQQTSKVF